MMNSPDTMAERSFSMTSTEKDALIDSIWIKSLSVIASNSSNALEDQNNEGDLRYINSANRYEYLFTADFDRKFSMSKAHDHDGDFCMLVMPKTRSLFLPGHRFLYSHYNQSKFLSDLALGSKIGHITSVTRFLKRDFLLYYNVWTVILSDGNLLDIDADMIGDKLNEKSTT